MHLEHVSLSAQVSSQGLCGWRAFRVPPLSEEWWSCWSIGGVLGMLSSGTSRCSDEVVLLRATIHICSCQSQCWWARHSWQVLRDLQWDLRLSSSHPSPLPTPCFKVNEDTFTEWFSLLGENHINIEKIFDKVNLFIPLMYIFLFCYLQTYQYNL